MSEDFEVSIRTDEVIKGISLIPAIGFVLALCHEGGYFLTLGISAGYVVSLQDIVRESSFVILPMIPFALFGSWMGSKPPPELGNSTRKKIIYFIAPIPGDVIVIAVYLCVLSFILLGTAPKIGIFLFYIVVVMSVGMIALRRLVNQLVYNNFYLIAMIFVAMGTFAGIGASKAYDVRSGIRDKFPIVSSSIYLEVSNKTSYVLRRFSSGLLVGTSDREKIWFLNSSAGSIMEFRINPEPYRGLLCYSLEWCWASGWLKGHKGLNKPVEQER